MLAAFTQSTSVTDGGTDGNIAAVVHATRAPCVFTLLGLGFQGTGLSLVDVHMLAQNAIDTRTSETEIG